MTMLWRQAAVGVSLCAVLVDCGASSRPGAPALAVQACDAAQRETNEKATVEPPLRPHQDTDEVTGVMLDGLETQLGDGADAAAQAAALDASYTQLVTVLTSAESAAHELGRSMDDKGEDMTTWQQADLDQWHETARDLTSDFETLSALCRIERAR